MLVTKMDIKALLTKVSFAVEIDKWNGLVWLSENVTELGMVVAGWNPCTVEAEGGV